MNKKSDKIEYLLDKLQQEQQRFKEEQANIKSELVKQKKKSKRAYAYILIIALLFCGISNVFSYSFGASSVAYTPTDSNWKVANTQEAIDDLFDSVGSALVGSIYSYMGTTSPHGYLACDGSVYKISDYERLANHIQQHFGSYNFFGGDGVTTFAVPDLRGEFLRGTGTNSHDSQGSGANVGTHQDGTVHTYVTTVNAGTAVLVANYINSSNKPIPKNIDSFTSSGGRWTSVSGGLGNNVGSEAVYTSRPTNTSVLYIIKY